MTKSKLLPRSAHGSLLHDTGVLLARGRFRQWWWLVVVYLGLSTITRIALFAVALANDQAGPANLLPVLGIGLIYDLVATLHLFALYIFYLAFLPESQREVIQLLAKRSSAPMFRRCQADQSDRSPVNSYLHSYFTNPLGLL